jgi:hypothetical protein
MVGSDAALEAAFVDFFVLLVDEGEVDVVLAEGVASADDALAVAAGASAELLPGSRISLPDFLLFFDLLLVVEGSLAALASVDVSFVAD